MRGRTRVAWTDHPCLAFNFEVRTRLGIAPNHRSFRAGVLRTHLLTALYARVVAERRQTAAEIYARFDDTNPARTEGVETAGLLREIRHVAQVPLSPIPRSLEVDGLTIHQSRRRGRYVEVLRRLDELGLIREHDGTSALHIPAVDLHLSGRGVNPARLVADSLVNIARVPVDHPREHVPLVRADGAPLWHLASVVDDVDLGINLIVRGTDKINAVAIQERLRWVVSEGRQRVAYIFVPRLVESDREKSRVARILESGTRPASLRWYLAEPFCDDSRERLPETFDEIVRRVGRASLKLNDTGFDPQKLAAVDRKMSAQRSTEGLRQDLIERVGAGDTPIIDFILREWRRPLREQVRLYRGLTSSEVDFDPTPRDAVAAVAWVTAYLSGVNESPIPYGVRWLLTGCAQGPSPEALLRIFPRELLNPRLAAARKVLT